MDGDSRRLQDLVTALDGHIRTVRAQGLDHAAALLCMARLELQLQIHGITDAELRALSEALARTSKPDPDIDVIDLASRRAQRRAKA
jgi:hypothetical protein